MNELFSALAVLLLVAYGFNFFWTLVGWAIYTDSKEDKMFNDSLYAPFMGIVYSMLFVWWLATGQLTRDEEEL